MSQRKLFNGIKLKQSRRFAYARILDISNDRCVVLTLGALNQLHRFNIRNNRNQCEPLFQIIWDNNSTVSLH